MKRCWKILLWLVVLGTATFLFAALYIRTHPLVFNESLFGHAHCMPQAGLALRQYAADHDGKFPTHTNGYGDALLLIAEPGQCYYLTGPGYSAQVFEDAVTNRAHVPEAMCGRVYVQGLSETNDSRIVVLFNKIAAPPDHCHFPFRLWASYVREVCFLDGSWRTVSVGAWPEFADEQIRLLAEAGFPKSHATALYAEVK
jgi:hypothetical protein